MIANARSVGAGLARRRALGALAALAAAVAVRRVAAQADSARKVPDSATFQSGDFVWPKKPGDIVPYHSGAESSLEENEKRWLMERAEYVKRVRANPKSTLEERQLVTNLEAMDFREFLALYQADISAAVPQPYGGGAAILYVGHVGVISIAGGAISMIEALWEKGVVRTPYEQWLKARSGSWVWHGRAAGKGEAERARVAAAAEQYLGRPYVFWNFDLADVSGFYCSKLCWLSVREALGIALDGNANPKRTFWFSPKQMLKASAIARLFVPGSYTF